MTLTSEIKKEVIDKHQLSKEDTGSTNVQIALLTKKIDSLSDHFKICLLYTSPSPRDRG